MLKALNETDEKEKTLIFEKGLKIFESSVEHTCYNQGRVETYLNTHSELRDQLRKEFYDVNSNPEAVANRFWNHLVDQTKAGIIWKLSVF